MKTQWIVLAIAAAMLGGCTSMQTMSRQSDMDIELTLLTDLAGATVSVNGKSICTTPCTRVFNLRNTDPRTDILISTAWTIQWDSGAKVTSRREILRQDVAKHGRKMNLKFERPAGAPNLAMDRAKHDSLVSQNNSGGASDFALLMISSFLDGYNNGAERRRKETETYLRQPTQPTYFCDTSKVLGSYSTTCMPM